MGLLSTAALLIGCGAGPSAAPTMLTLKNRFVLRQLQRQGAAWRTVRFARADGSDEIRVRSDEFHILLLNDQELTLDDYGVDGEPQVTARQGEQRAVIRYRLLSPSTKPPAAPRAVVITYRLADEPYLRKQITLVMKQGQAVDRLQVERFITRAPLRRGGRGEPVFLGQAWFAGLEHPASYIRWGSDFHYPQYPLRNPSIIHLKGRDRELKSAPAGLVTMAHFPGAAKPGNDGGEWTIQSQTSVFGLGHRGDTTELAFLDYLRTIRRAPPRSYLHHNNWYDASGKDLSAANYIGRTYRQLRDGLQPYGVTLDGMVPDSGWQDRRSIWRPKSGVDFVALRDALARASGGKTRLGLWLALNGYSLDIDWGVQHGYAEAVRNDWFRRFKRYYSLTQPQYNRALRAALRALITAGDLNYFKHDFNEMCDLGEGRGHLPTDRHGHEADVDAEIDLLQYERQLQPDIFQNLTNWIWFSPWWLRHCDCLWMMGSDSGSDWSWPQLAVRDIAITFRDEHFARVWGDPERRPLIPISALMTHGIIFADRNRRGDAAETVHDWANYVVMYYGRGVMLKELYLTPSMMTAERWKVLGQATRWAVDNASLFVNTVFVGGHPAQGQVYGYVSWTADRGVLTVRNPDRRQQTLRVPFDQTTWYRGPAGQPWNGRVVYPYVEPLGRTLVSGQPFTVTIPGDSVMAFELRRGAAKASQPAQPQPAPEVQVRRAGGALQLTIPVPDEEMLRCDLVIQVFRGHLPALSLNGDSVTPQRRTQGRTKRDSPRPKPMADSTEWTIAAIDLRPHRGQTVRVQLGSNQPPQEPFASGGEAALDVWWVADRQVDAPPAPADEALPWPIAQEYRRQTAQLIPPTQVHTPEPESACLRPGDWQRLTAAKVRVRIFGISGGRWGPVTLHTNGGELLSLPPNKGGDRWETVVLDIPADRWHLLQATMKLQVRNPHRDKFKLADLTIAVRGPDGRWSLSRPLSGVLCSSSDWKHAEGAIFPDIQASAPARIDFPACGQ